MKPGRYLIGILNALAWALPCLASGRVVNPDPIPLASIRDVRDLGEVSLSPDGRSVAATVVSSMAEGGQTHIWLLGRDGHAPRQLTSSPASTNSTTSLKAGGDVPGGLSLVAYAMASPIPLLSG